MSVCIVLAAENRRARNVWSFGWALFLLILLAVYHQPSAFTKASFHLPEEANWRI